VSAETEAFFKLHSGLPREAPGDRESLDWAMALASPPADARILDAGCGPGADIEGLLAAAPSGKVTAIDLHEPFVATARERYAGDSRVEASIGDMANPGGPFDLIWSAGALYFLGIEAGLMAWREALVPGGVVAFSDAIWLTEDRPADVLKLFADYKAMTDLNGDIAACSRAGYEVLGHRILPDAAWEAYFQPMEVRIAELRVGADPVLNQILDEAVFEIETWRAHRDAFGYATIVARKR
jgi:SAM-dependent methyltransferase